MTGRPTTNVRAAVPEDEAAIHTLAAGMATSFVVERESFQRSLVDVLASETAVLLVAETDSAISGYVLGFTHPAFYANGHVAWVEEIVVAPKLRRQHIGATLMDEFERRALTTGALVVALATRRASDFYSALGYQESATYYRKIL
ncbi:GNAT family N-acetyltransferase [Pseudonocardia sp. NPDC046786]|uniref:GNAT family N-acetyltransferase n=1 Tax=Pseudonocardia sp. NPDC046786 TaxID=3155471 RepID=UPI0033C64EB3